MLKKDTKVRITEIGAEVWDELAAGDEGYLTCDHSEPLHYVDIRVPTKDEFIGGDFAWPLSPSEFEVIE